MYAIRSYYALWYSKALFGVAWMQEVGLTEEAVRNGNSKKAFTVVTPGFAISVLV